VVGSSDGVGSQALFNNPTGIAVDGAGVVYIADTGNSTIRRVATGSVTTLAGLPGIAGLRNGSGVEAWFNQPKALALDSTGALYIADTGNAVVRKIDLAGNVTTLALTEGTSSSSGTGNSGVTVTVSSGGATASGSGSTEPWFVAALVTLAVAAGCRRKSDV
jgi:sugar lactone lactonase YvrE